MVLKCTPLNRILVLNMNSIFKFSINCAKTSLISSHMLREFYSGYHCRPNLKLHSKSSSLLQKQSDQLKLPTLFTRGKSSRQRRSAEYESESDSDNEMEVVPGAKVLQIQTGSLRCDMILKQGLGLSRNKLEILFYEGRIRVNGEKIQKKSVDVEINDEIDVIKEISDENPHFIIVSRVEIMKGRPTGDVIILTIRKHKSILIENYVKHPWKEADSENTNENE